MFEILKISSRGGVTLYVLRFFYEIRITRYGFDNYSGLNLGKSQPR